MRLEFTIPGEPVAKGRARMTVIAGRAHAYTPSKTRKAEETLVARALPFKPANPLTSPLRLVAVFRFPVPASWPRWKRDAALKRTYQHVTKPDCDNLVKSLKDAFNGVFWLDDKQVYEVSVMKMYAAVPETYVAIIECENHCNSKNYAGSTV